MNSIRYSDPAELNALMRLCYATGVQHALAGGSTAFGAGGPASGCRRGSKPHSKSLAAHRVADARTQW
jgi:hypothetical protein